MLNASLILTLWSETSLEVMGVISFLDISVVEVCGVLNDSLFIVGLILGFDSVMIVSILGSDAVAKCA